jgi:hypothetical protein
MGKRLTFAITAAALIIGAWYFQAQNAHAAQAKVSQILAADAASADTTTALASLKAYVAGHMGTSVSFTLNGAYARAQAAATAATNAANANANVYAAAQAACSGKTDSITQAECNQRYLDQHLVNEPSPTATAAPQLASYQYHLRAPLWSPDLPGVLYLAAAGLIALAIVSGRRRRQAGR